MSVRLNSTARRRVLDKIFPLTVVGGEFKDLDFRLGLYSGPPPGIISATDGALPSVHLLAAYFVRLSITPDARMIYLDSNYTVIQAQATGRVGSWILMNATDPNSFLSGVSVADQVSGESACLVLNDLNTVKDTPVQLVDFSVRVG